MTSKFFVPVATMIAGILVWVAFLVLCETGDVMNEWSKWLGAGFCLATGGLVVFSGIRCRQVGGPRVGSIVRTILLIIMAAITYWRIDVVFAGVLAAAAIVTGILAIMGDRPDAVEDSNSAR